MNSPSSSSPARSSGSAEDEAAWPCRVPRSPAWGTGLAVAQLQDRCGICCRATRFGRALQDRGSPSGRSRGCSSFAAEL